MAIFKINQLRVMTFLGTYAFEQKVKQTLLIDLEFTLDIKKAALSNALTDTLDYSLIASQLTHFLENHSFLLIESLMEQAAEFLKKTFSFTELKLKITKVGCISNAKDISLEALY